VDGIFVALPIKLTSEWTNLSLRFATEFATQAHVWRSVGARSHLGQLHKSFIDKYKPFIHNSLQTGHTDQISVALLGLVVLKEGMPATTDVAECEKWVTNWVSRHVITTCYRLAIHLSITCNSQKQPNPGW